MYVYAHLAHTHSANLYHNAWLTSNNTRDCIDSSEPCFSCCFTKPTHQCSVDTCLFEEGIVLQCCKLIILIASIRDIV